MVNYYVQLLWVQKEAAADKHTNVIDLSGRCHKIELKRGNH